MKYVILFMMLGIVSVSAEVYTQKTTISINIQNGSIYDIVSEIEKQTEFMFFYKSNDINNDLKVTVQAQDQTVSEILNDVTKGADLAYSVNNRVILLAKRADMVAQQIRVSGTVTDTQGEPLPGVNIFLKGTTTGVISDGEGQYAISVPDVKTVLVFSYVGYAAQEIVVGNRARIDVTLSELSVQVDEVVVTALGMKRSEKVLGYATQKVGGEQFEKVKGANLLTSMTGRISGLTIFNSTEFMDNPTIKLRGAEPLIVLDGVPTSLSFIDLNQDDILSIDVLKGATASALYGSKGGSGAIMITTKKGGKKGFSVEVNTSNMFNMGELALPEGQTSYSSGYGGKYNTDDEVWGDKLDIGRMYEQWDPLAKEYRMTELTSKGKNNFRNFLVPSMISNTSVSVVQQGENGSIRSSLSYLYDKGQYPNTRMNQLRYTLGGEMKLGNKVSVEGTIGYTRRTSPNSSGYGYTNQGYIYNLLVWTGPEYDVRDYRDYWIIPNEKQNFHYNAWYDNPYLMAYEKLNTQNYNRMNAMLSINYQILPWMKAILRSGGDLHADLNQKRAPLDIHSQREWGSTNKGYYSESQQYYYTVTNDFLLLMDKRFGAFSIDGLLGGSINMTYDKSLQANTRNGLSVPGFYSLKASVDNPAVSPSIKEKQVNSLFGKLTVGYRDAFYVDLTGRNDWSSTLPVNENSYFYPSVGGSVIMSEFLSMPQWLPFWKLRGSWTVSKNDLDIYALNQAYSVTNNAWDGLNSATYPTTIRGDVKPITDRTWEAGTDFYLLPGNRLKVGLTYFDRLRYNMTTSALLSDMSGYKSRLLNVDEEYDARGFEITLDALAVKAKDFSWNVLLNWSTIKEYYAQLDETYSADVPWIYKGARRNPVTVRKLEYTPDGSLIHYSDGMPRQSQYNSRIGYVDPDWIWGLTNVFRYKSVALSIAFDGRVGGRFLSQTNYRMLYTGSHPETDNSYRYEEVVNGNKTFIGNGVKLVSGSATYDAYGNIVTDDRTYAPNDIVVSYESYMKSAYKEREQLYFDQTFFKLREISISYDLPKTIAPKIGASHISAALIGQNLLLWTKEFKYADPDKGSDELASPSVRYLGINLKVAF
ncbi:MAG: SusC/RagA family TonB-linked outer membrane protein [Tannerella sp.]|nr:SusC/RagA family TonB-linked outer membrane protein [Tannerella sp.]